MTKQEYQEAAGFYTEEIGELEQRRVLVEFKDDGDGTGVVVVDNDRGTRIDIITAAELGAFFVGVRMGARGRR